MKVELLVVCFGETNLWAWLTLDIDISALWSQRMLIFFIQDRVFFLGHPNLTRNSPFFQMVGFSVILLTGLRKFPLPAFHFTAKKTIAPIKLTVTTK
jgi:hypothetical protein